MVPRCSMSRASGRHSPSENTTACPVSFLILRFQGRLPLYAKTSSDRFTDLPKPHHTIGPHQPASSSSSAAPSSKSPASSTSRCVHAYAYFASCVKPNGTSRAHSIHTIIRTDRAWVAPATWGRARPSWVIPRRSRWWRSRTSTSTSGSRCAWPPESQV